MPIGNNEGGQNNILLFEVGYVRRVTPDADEVVRNVAIHPLVVAPQQLAYTDTSRSTVVQTLGRKTRIVADRNLRAVQLSGVFGVEDRGFGDYRGTGPSRFQRFYNEVVRFSDVRTAEDLAGLINDLSGSPAIRARLAGYDAATCVPYVNFFDLLNQRSFAVNVEAWSDSIGARNGGATGNRAYTLRVVESGPVVASKLTDRVLRPLFSGLSIWKNGIDVLRAYDEEGIADALPSLNDVLLAQLTAAVQATADRSEEARALFGGTRRPRVSNATMSFAGAVDALRDAVRDAVAAAQNDIAPIDAPPGRVESWFVAKAFDGVDAAERVDTVEGLGVAADETRGVGVYLGLSRDEFLRVIATGGLSQRSTPTTTITHVVSATDTERTIEERYTVRFEDVLEANNLLPDEALFPGQKLAIPVAAVNGPRFIDGLPTFDNQVGARAWGADLDLDLNMVDGDLAVIAGADVLVQGVRVLQEQTAAELLDATGEIPGVSAQTIIARKMEQTVLSDARIESVPRLDVRREDAAVVVSMDVRAINTRDVVGVVLDAA